MGGLKKVGMVKTTCLVIAMHLLAMSVARAESKTCRDLALDLKAMQRAQSQLLSSFGQKNEGLATTFDVHANNLEKALHKKGQLKKSDFQGLKRSADALRKHQEKESDLVARFEKATGLLLAQVQSCLENTSSISSSQSVADHSSKN